MKKHGILLFVLLVFSCSRNKSDYPQLSVPQQPDVLSVDTKEMLSVDPVVFGFNFTQDTDDKSHIYKSFDKIKNKAKETRLVYFGGMVLNENFIIIPQDTVLPRMDLSVIVDTTYTIPRKGIQYKNHIPTFDRKLIVDEESEIRLMKPYYDKRKRLSERWIECYPVLIYNKSKKAAVVTCKLIQEAKDEKGIWRPIEFMKNGPASCCIPSPEMKLFPECYFATSIIKYHGSFKTKLRIKYASQWEVYYSNEFNGYVNPSQFDMKPFMMEYDFFKTPRTCDMAFAMDLAFLKCQRDLKSNR